MVEENIEELVEQLKKEREENLAKINGLTKSLEEMKINKDKEVLIAKINSMGSDVEPTESVDYMRGFHDCLLKLNTKSIDEKVNSIPQGAKIPPMNTNVEYVNTPLGIKPKSDVEESKLAKINGKQIEMGVK